VEAEQGVLGNMIKRQSLLIIQPASPKDNELIFRQYPYEPVDLGFQAGDGLLATSTNHHLFSLIDKSDI
jgi:hypothetical protein